MPPKVKQSYFNGLAAVWDTLPSPEDFPSKVRRFVERSCVPEQGWILDAGCGTGVLLPALLEHPGRARVLETDFSEEMLRMNRRGATDPWVWRTCADAARMPVRLASLDLVLCFGLLPHVEDVGRALAEFLRVLKPGGALAIGHAMGSRELNAFHGSLEGPVSKDLLPPAREVAERLSRLGAVAIQAEEEPAWYFVRAERAGQ